MKKAQNLKHKVFYTLFGFYYCWHYLPPLVSGWNEANSRETNRIELFSWRRVLTALMTTLETKFGVVDLCFLNSYRIVTCKWSEWCPLLNVQAMSEVFFSKSWFLQRAGYQLSGHKFSCKVGTAEIFPATEEISYGFVLTKTPKKLVFYLGGDILVLNHGLKAGQM